MKTYNEVELGEGSINNLSKTIDTSKRLLTNNLSKEKSISFKNKKIIEGNQKNSVNSFSLKDTITMKKYINRLKSFGSNSTTTMSSNNEKIKKVTFSTINIIRIQNYKEYNKLNSYKNIETKNKWEENEGCKII